MKSGSRLDLEKGMGGFFREENFYNIWWFDRRFPCRREGPSLFWQDLSSLPPHETKHTGSRSGCKSKIPQIIFSVQHACTLCSCHTPISNFALWGCGLCADPPHFYSDYGVLFLLLGLPQAFKKQLFFIFLFLPHTHHLI